MTLLLIGLCLGSLAIGALAVAVCVAASDTDEHFEYLEEENDFGRGYRRGSESVKS